MMKETIVSWAFQKKDGNSIVHLMMIRVNRKEARLLEDAINEWERDAMIDAEIGDKLKKTISPTKYDYTSFSFYAFIAAISCAILAFGALVLDEKWIERMRKYFEFTEMAIAIAFLVFTILLTLFAKKRKARYPYATLANESFTVLIVLSIGVSVAYFTRGFGIPERNYGISIFIAGLLLGMVAIYIQSKLLWVAMLVAIIVSWGTQTYEWSHGVQRSFFWGMNYPMRMTALALVFWASSSLLSLHKRLIGFYNITYYFSLIYFLLFGLILSVSGNLEYQVWAAIRQGKLYLWAISYTLLLIGLIFYSIKIKDEFFTDIVLVFFILNIYTRFFEYFWDVTHKGIFFAILAFSFWWIGKKFEDIRKTLHD